MVTISEHRRTKRNTTKYTNHPFFDVLFSIVIVIWKVFYILIMALFVLVLCAVDNPYRYKDYTY